jgi:hypothetical protein
MKTTITEWYARGGGIAKSGPHASQAMAAAAIMGVNGFPVEDAFIWPVEVEREVLSTSDEYVVWAALSAMVDDVHCAQDQLTEEQWAHASNLFQRLTKKLNAKSESK